MTGSEYSESESVSLLNEPTGSVQEEAVRENSSDNGFQIWRENGIVEIILIMRPRSVLRPERERHYKGAKKQYSRKKSCHYHYYQYTRPTDIKNVSFSNTS